MFSKFILLSLLSVLFFVISCGIHLNESAPKEKAIQYSGKGYSCIGEIPQHFEKFIGNELDEAQISDFTRCLQRSLASFMNLTSDRHQSVYRPEDIRRFLQDYFLRKRSISDELLKQFMKIKQALVGGSLETITRPELIEAINLLEDIRVEAIRLKPHLPYLNSTLVATQSPHALGKHLSDAGEALRHTIDLFSSKLKNSKKPYMLTDLADFMREFRKFVDWDHHFSSVHSVDQWIALVKIFKEITLSPKNPDRITTDEWAPLLQACSNWYLSFLEYKVGVGSQVMMSGSGLQNVHDLGTQLFALSTQAVQAQPMGYVGFDQLHRLFESLHSLKWIPEKIRVSSLDSFFTAIVTRMFGDIKVRPGDRVAKGLTVSNIEAMQLEFERWYDVQRDLEREFNPEQNPAESLVNIQDSVPRLHIQDVPTVTDDSRSNFAPKSSHWDDFMKVKILRPLFANDFPRVMLVPDSQTNTPELNFGFYDLSVKNILRSAVTVMFNGYAEDNKWFWTSGVTAAEMQKFYEDIRDLGIDLAIVDKRNATSGNRAFIEGKLFTYASQGLHPESPGIGSEMSSIETMAYLAFLYSGSSEATQIFENLLRICPNGPLDVNGVHKVDRACALANMPDFMNQFMRNMPHLLEYLNATTPENRTSFAQTALLSAYSSITSDPAFLEKNEMSTVAVVIHYVEAVMTRYDTNQDGILTPDEFEAAVPIFSGFIRKIAVEKASASAHGVTEFLMGDHNASGAFYFILKYGKIPEVSDLWTIEHYGFSWGRPALGKDGKGLDRLGLMDVFKAIIQNLLASSKAPVAPLPAVPAN